MRGLHALAGLASVGLSLVAALLPRRRWDAYPGLPISTHASTAAALTVVAGVLAGVAGFFEYARHASVTLVDETLIIAARQAQTAPRDAQPRAQETI